jgi:drug/metabolite transporter (DMT)-like permease
MVDNDRRQRRRTGPGRTLLGFLVFYAVAFGTLALAGYDDALPALRLVLGALAGYGVGHLASRSLGRPGEIVATVLFFAALGAMTIVSAVVVAAEAAEASDPWWSASLGFASGVLAAAYVRLKYYLVER